MYTINELLFPDSAIAFIRLSRGPQWQRLVDYVQPLAADHPHKLAFCLTMIRRNGCMDCETDSYRAMRGCVACAQQTLRRYKQDDHKLIAEYGHALRDVCAYLGVTDGDYPLPDEITTWHSSDAQDTATAFDEAANGLLPLNTPVYQPAAVSAD